MSDDAGRPERKPFEPPPWEREQFEELARKRAAQAAETESDRSADEVTASATEAGETEDDETEGGRRKTLAGEQASPGKKASTGLDERQAAAMMLQLSGEESSSLQPMRRAGLVTAAILGTVGAVIVAVGLAFMTRSVGGAPAGVAGAAIVVVFGGLILGSAVWLWIRVERGQGADVRG